MPDQNNSTGPSVAVSEGITAFDSIYSGVIAVANNAVGARAKIPLSLLDYAVGNLNSVAGGGGFTERAHFTAAISFGLGLLAPVLLPAGASLLAILAAGTVLSWAGTKLGEWLYDGGYEATVEIVNEIGEAVGEMVVDVIDKISEKISNGIDNVSDFLDDLQTSVGEWLDGLPSDISDVFDGLEQALFGPDGLLGTPDGALDRLVDALGGGVLGILGGLLGGGV